MISGPTDRGDGPVDDQWLQGTLCVARGTPPAGRWWLHSLPDSLPTTEEEIAIPSHGCVPAGSTTSAPRDRIWCRSMTDSRALM
ncbi:hypothetical protein DQ238_05130 [Geodermatophilus sp. TF02-6]|nr:hypothetical protein DQ238_05130 [Geodermatophilus sp. TF02-6]